MKLGPEGADQPRSRPPKLGRGYRALWILGAVAFVLGCFGFSPSSGLESSARDDGVTVLITGDFAGSLSPCGCTSPMVGGVRRLATAIKQLRGSGPSVLLSGGGLLGVDNALNPVSPKQNLFKLDAAAEILAAAGVDALGLGDSDLTAGRGGLISEAQLSGNRVVVTDLAPSPTNAYPRWRSAGPFLVGATLSDSEALARQVGETALAPDTAIDDLLAEAHRTGQTAALLFRGNLAAARSVAQKHPDLGLIVYRGEGAASTEASSEGKTALVSPGDKGKALVRLRWLNGRITNYEAVVLTPAFADDPVASRAYRSYLKRVSRAGLLDAWPREATAKYGGDASCVKCHAADQKCWLASAHSHALHDLAVQGHDQDPDCVRCHVTGLNSTEGFRSLALTPRLANVTCEACHGPALDHTLAPKQAVLKKLGRDSCLNCHTPDNSPGFAFDAYWKKVFHH